MEEKKGGEGRRLREERRGLEGNQGVGRGREKREEWIEVVRKGEEQRRADMNGECEEKEEEKRVRERREGNTREERRREE